MTSLPISARSSIDSSLRSQGIVRARWRESDVTPTLIEPGEVYEYTIDPWATAHSLAPSHRVLLEMISSSNFDRDDRNPNTGHPFDQDAERRPAAQTIFHDAARPSRITLPVLERAAMRGRSGSTTA